MHSGHIYNIYLYIIECQISQEPFAHQSSITDRYQLYLVGHIQTRHHDTSVYKDRFLLPVCTNQI